MQHLTPLFLTILTFEMTFICSTVFHWFGPVSKSIMNTTKRLDYSFAMMSCFAGPFAMFYYNFQERYVLVISLFLVCFLLNVVCFVLNLGEWIHHHSRYLLKVKIFSFAGFSSIFLPNSIQFVKRLVLGRGDDELMNPYSTFYYISSWLAMIIGVACFVTKYPEKLYPGKFNIVVSILMIWLILEGSSHQIWHLMVIYGLFATTYGVYLDAGERMNKICYAA